MLYFIRRNRLIIFTIASIIGLPLLWNPTYLWLVAINYFFFGLGAEIGLHRYFAHNSFTCGIKSKVFLWICIFLSGTSDPIGYARQHRYHHKHSDTELDNFQAVTHPWKTWVGTKIVDLSSIKIDDLMQNNFNKFMYKHYFNLYFLLLTVMLFLNVTFAFYFFILATTLVINTVSAINVFCHRYGYRNFNTFDRSTNNTYLNLISFGGALHHNHHANPRSYTTTVNPSELDIFGLLIKYIFSKTSNP